MCCGRISFGGGIYSSLGNVFDSSQLSVNKNRGVISKNKLVSPTMLGNRVWDPGLERALPPSLKAM